ncbi:GNAT family N-acetyltransferase [Thioclava sp. GXIMD4215]|uniref:GNAT family N-acetyltransferase n=1 Tax=Thioclava sp. GXIMD4215 TaxID=3131928 RepID=UPI0032505C86
MSYHIRRGVPEHHRKAAAQLYWQAFGGKLGRVLGPEPQALAFIARVMDGTHGYCAVEDDSGTLLAVAGFRTAQGAFVGGDHRDLRAIYGLGGAVWRWACLWVLARDQEHRAMVVDGLSVRADQRSRGIGAALITAVCTEARRRGYVQLRLDVVKENMRARALYERLGFRVIRARESRLTELLFAYRTAFVMVCPLRPWGASEAPRGSSRSD